MREELIKIYQDTKQVCSSIPVPKSEKFSWDTDEISTNTAKKAGNIIVEPMDTISALVKYSKRGKTAILNMASAKRKGGGVENGAMAQEECLFRCSNLFTISDDFYPLGEDQYIYTYDATFVKDVNYGIMEPVTADVITIPAINLNGSHIDFSKPGFNNDKEQYECIMLDKMFWMINSSIISGCDNIILGAWGCGVFKNDPSVVSRLFKEVLEGDLQESFNNVVFAIINDRNSVGNNYEIFKNTLEN